MAGCEKRAPAPAKNDGHIALADAHPAGDLAVRDAEHGRENYAVVADQVAEVGLTDGVDGSAERAAKEAGPEPRPGAASIEAPRPLLLVPCQEAGPAAEASVTPGRRGIAARRMASAVTC